MSARVAAEHLAHGLQPLGGQRRRRGGAGERGHCLLQNGLDRGTEFVAIDVQGERHGDAAGREEVLDILEVAVRRAGEAVSEAGWNRKRTTVPRRVRWDTLLEGGEEGWMGAWETAALKENVAVGGKRFGDEIMSTSGLGGGEMAWDGRNEGWWREGKAQKRKTR